MKQRILLMIGSTLILMQTACGAVNPPEAQGNNGNAEQISYTESLFGPGPANASIFRDDPNETSPTSFNQGTGYISVTENNHTKGNDQRRLEHIAEEKGFTTAYVMTGGSHATLFVIANQDWNKEEKDKKKKEVEKQLRQEMPRFDARVQIINNK